VPAISVQTCGLVASIRLQIRELSGKSRSWCYESSGYSVLNYLFLPIDQFNWKSWQWSKPIPSPLSISDWIARFRPYWNT
jgi:hypothetical protein